MEKEYGEEGELGFQVSMLGLSPSPVNAPSTEPPPVRVASPKSMNTGNAALSPNISSRLSVRSTTSTRDSVSSNHYVPIPNADLLPTSMAALEGLLNHHTSQLQKLADRVEAVNEWIDLDRIVLARISADDTTEADRAAEEAAEEAATEAEGVGQASASGYHAGAEHTGGNGQAAESSADGVSCRVREATERIKWMRRWRKELERSVCWQREEYWRVEKAMGRKQSESLGRSKEGKSKWVGASGKIPTQREWEMMFSY